jgi:integrase
MSSRRKTIATFADIAPLYLAGRQVSPAHRRTVTATAARAGKVAVDALNRYLCGRVELVSGQTLKTERSICLSLWRWAYDQGLFETAPRGVMRLKARRKPTKAWTLDQIRQILAACDNASKRPMWSGAAPRDFLRAWVLLAYETGARMGDVFSFTRDQIDGDTIAWVQSKTGDPLTRTLTPACQQAVQVMLAKSPDGSILGWACSRRQAIRRMRELLESCGLDGSSKWLRRSGATHCEMAQAGAGRLHLGHRSPALFESNYCDWGQLRTKTPQPPQLIGGEG